MLWTCPKNHTFKEVNICQRGFPQQCPACHLKNLEEKKKDILSGCNPSSIALPEELLGFKCEKLKYSIEEFYELQATLVQKLVESVDMKKLSLYYPLVVPRVFPCFNILPDSKVNTSECLIQSTF